MMRCPVVAIRSEEFLGCFDVKALVGTGFEDLVTQKTCLAALVLMRTRKGGCLKC